MVWIVLAVAVVVVAVIANEIRIAPEQNDDYEVHLREHYRQQATDEKQTSTEKRKLRRPDAA